MAPPPRVGVPAILARVLLGAFLPVVMGMAGNVGVQSATVAVRGLATGAIDVRDTVPVVFKELRVGLAATPSESRPKAPESSACSSSPC